MDVKTSNGTPSRQGVSFELHAVVDAALPMNPAQLAEQMIREKWGAAIDPQTAHLVTLHYDYWLRPEPDGSHKGRVASSQSLVQVLLSNYQTVGDGRFGETAFGLYTPPDVGPAVHLMDGPEPTEDHRTYEGIYRPAVPQTYGPQTQINLRPADFKQWVWTLFFDEAYQAYVDKSWPSDEVLLAASAYPLRTSTKAAFVMTAWLQFHEHGLSRKGLALAMQAAGLPPEQRWDLLKMAQLQASTRLSPEVELSRLKIYRYTATDIWCFRHRGAGRVLMYIPGNSSPLHEFSNAGRLRRWIVEQGTAAETRQALALHFADEDRHDGTFHAGVLTALEGMAQFPDQHRLSREAGFFNNDGYWDPAQYIGFGPADAQTDPFAQLVLTMKQSAQASVKTIRNDAQVNRDNLNAVIEPVVQWVNRFGPLALFVPGGEGVLALAGLIDAGYGLEQVVDGETSSQRSQGAVRTVFGLLNALPLAAEAISVGRDGAEAAELIREGQTGPAASTRPGRPPLSRVELLRGIGTPAGTFSDEVLAQIGTVSAVDDDMLRLIQAGRAQEPLLTDTIERFRIDQEVAGLTESPIALFNTRYQALQYTEHEWVRLFQRQYPDLPTAVVEQILDRHGIDFTAPAEAAQARQLFRQLDGKARQYQRHLRLNRTYEGLYLRSVISADSDTLALHSLPSLPGWPRDVRIEVLDGTQGERLLDRIGPLDTSDCRRLIKTHNLYRPYSFSGQAGTGTHFYDAICEVLSDEERSALHLLSKEPGRELRFNVGKQPLSRAELALGLGRMDSGLPFEAHGLRGGGFPQTPQGPALTHATMKIQVREIYPDFSSDEADALLHQLGDGAQSYLSSARQRLYQLYVDLDAWVDQVATDIDDMDIQFLHMGDPGTEGFTEAQLRRWNAQRVQETMDLEGEARNELGDELIAILQKRAPQQRNHFSGDAVVGYTIDLSNEDFHRVPELHARFNDVVGMNVQNFHLFERETLNRFLESFPNLRTLNLEGTDLRILDAAGEFQSALPPAIPQLQHLVSLNLRATRLTFREETAAQLSSLINLQSLDLSENPLRVPPVVLGMDQLRVLKLNDTGIAACPIGIGEQPYMTTLDLRNNRIRRVPQAVLNQAVDRDRVLIWNNPLTDEDTLQRLVRHREQIGVNLWLRTPPENYADPAAWLNGIETGQRNVRLQVWHRLALKPRGGRFLGTMNTLTLTADFQVNYLDLQVRVWRLLTRVDASQELWDWLNQTAPMPAGNFDDPYSVFAALEDRARLFDEQAG